MATPLPASPTYSNAASIVTTLLMQAPPGELKDVLHDLRCLQKNANAVDGSILSTVVEYNTKNNMEMTTATGERSIWAPQASDKARLVDKTRGFSYAVDHMSLTLSDPRPISANRPDAKWIAIDSAAKTYCESVFPMGTHLVITEKVENAPVYTILFVCTRFDKTNCWNGRWHSQWIWSPSQLSLRGTASIFVHSFEEGNVQLDFKESYASPLAADADAAAIIAEIDKHEVAFKKTLTKSFDTMHEVLYRRLRRALPVTRTKMDWQKYALYRLVPTTQTTK